MRVRQIFVLAGAGSLWDVIIRRLERVNAKVLILERSSAGEAMQIAGNTTSAVIMNSLRRPRT